MSTLLTQTSQTTEVKSNAKIGDFLYEFTYNYDPTKKDNETFMFDIQ